MLRPKPLGAPRPFLDLDRRVAQTHEGLPKQIDTVPHVRGRVLHLRVIVRHLAALGRRFVVLVVAEAEHVLCLSVCELLSCLVKYGRCGGRDRVGPHERGGEGRRWTYDAVQLVEDGEGGSLGRDGGVAEVAAVLGEHLVPGFFGCLGWRVGEGAVEDEGLRDGVDCGERSINHRGLRGYEGCWCGPYVRCWIYACSALPESRRRILGLRFRS